MMMVMMISSVTSMPIMVYNPVTTSFISPGSIVPPASLSYTLKIQFSLSFLDLNKEFVLSMVY